MLFRSGQSEEVQAEKSVRNGNSGQVIQKIQVEKLRRLVGRTDEILGSLGGCWESWESGESGGESRELSKS